MAAGLKLKSLAVIEEKEGEGRWVDIQHPAGGPFFMGPQKEKPLRIRIAGLLSKTFREWEKRRRRSLDGEVDEDKLDLEALQVLTLEWVGAFDDDGKEIPFTPENVQGVYGAPGAGFIFDRINRESGVHAAFFVEPSAKP